MNRLEGKVAIITGGASGLGEATARLFAQEGAAVALGDVHEQRGADVVKRIEADGGKAMFQITDVRDPDHVKSLVDAAEATFGHVHIMVANAGIGGAASRKQLEDVTEAEFEEVMQVNAAGAWSREIGGIPPAYLPPVRPIKGQMLALQMDPAAPLLRHVVWLPRGYLVPRLDGRLIIGATVEERGFDSSLTAGGLFALIEGAWRAVPAIEELAIAESWVGFRPGSRDDAPMLGPSGIDRLVIATGHHRNGILLTPVTAAVISAYILTGRLPEIALPMSPERFAAAATPGRRAAAGAEAR